MRIITSILLLFLSSNILIAQTESIPFDPIDSWFDSIYNYYSDHTFRLLSIDTLKFDNGENVFQVIEKTSFRNDTTIKVSSAELNYRADTIRNVLAYPSFTKVSKKLRFAEIDTIRDPDDPSLYSIEEFDSVDFWIAKTYELNYENYSDIVQKINQDTEKQNLKITYQSASFYGEKIFFKEQSAIKKDDFNDVDFILAFFYFKKDRITMRYEIIFEK